MNANRPLVDDRVVYQAANGPPIVGYIRDSLPDGRVKFVPSDAAYRPMYLPPRFQSHQPRRCWGMQLIGRASLVRSR